jgi:hypothetical protein
MPYSVNQGVRIHYQIEGDGQPLVLQHGFTDSLEAWYELGYVEGLKTDYRLILIDARGHGASDKPHQPDAYERDRNVADITTVLDDLEIPPCRLSIVMYGKAPRPTPTGRLHRGTMRSEPEMFTRTTGCILLDIMALTTWPPASCCPRRCSARQLRA